MINCGIWGNWLFWKLDVGFDGLYLMDVWGYIGIFFRSLVVDVGKFGMDVLKFLVME